MTPPPLFTRLLAWSLADDERDYVLGDFIEEYAAHTASHGVTEANRWYRREVARSLIFNLGRRRTRRHVPVPKDGFMTTLWLDVRYAVRQLRRAPGFSIPAAVTLALGIGAATAVFTVVHRVVLRPLPYPEPDQLVRLWDRNDQGGLPYFSVSPGNYFEWRRQSRTLLQLGAYREDGFTLATQDGGERIEGVRVTASMFDVLRVPMQAGRGFTADEDRPSSSPAAVVGSSLASRLGGPEAVLGRPLTVDGRAHTVVGVLPRGFEFPQQPGIQIMVPYALNEAAPERGAHFLRVLARMASGARIEAVQRELDAVAASLARAEPKYNTGWTVSILPLHSAVVGDVQQTLYLLMGAAGLLLLITCANVGGLLLARSQGREPELAMRAALGAGGWRIARQLVTESLVLSIIGGVVGGALAWAGVNVLLAVHPTAVPRASEIALDGVVLAFVAALCAATSVAFGVLPWFVHGRRTEIREAAGAGRSPRRANPVARRVLVAAEIALALSIGVGAVLLVRNLVALQNTDPGFATAGVLSIALRPPAGTYEAPPSRVRMYKEVLASLEGIPGVRIAGAAHRLPLAGNSSLPFGLAGRTVASGPPPQINYRSIAGQYFEALNMRMLQGRMFSNAEMWESGDAAIVNRAAVERFFDGADPLTQVINGPGNRPFRVVGVVEDVQETALNEAPAPALYLPYGAYPVPAMTLVMRGDIDPMALARPAREALRRVDPMLSPGRIQSLDVFLGEVVAAPRFSAMLLSIFATIALALAAVGVYAVTAFSVAQRTAEIGVRVALGASPRDVFRAVVLPGIKLAAAGTVAGLCCALIGARLLGGLVLGVDARQPVVFAATALALFFVATLATFIPARRATRIDPVVALRRQ